MADVNGFTAPGYERLADALGAELADYPDNGAAFAAVLDGQIVVNIWGGWADRKQDAPWREDTIAPVFSTTKAIASLVIARLAGQGAIDYDAPLAALWPEFSAHGKDRVTVAEALSHQAGVCGFPEPIDPSLWPDPPALAAALAALAPLWAPGTASGYHPLTWGYIAAEIVRRVSERSLGQILREDICAPRGIDFHIGLSRPDHERLAAMAKPRRFADFGAITPEKRAAFLTPWAGPQRGARGWYAIEVPSANGAGTALALARLGAILANRGVLGPDAIIAPRAFEALRTRRFFGRDLVLPFDIDWRTGVMANNLGFYGPNPETLGHSGSGGSCLFGDPARGLSGAYVMNAQSHHLIGDPRARALIGALYACLG